jgi:two-component system, cell cycle sensor histidine kinase and response regulator CckA
MPTEPTTAAPTWTEEKLRALALHSADIISLLDAQGHLLYNSPAAEQISGFSTAELSGIDTFQLIHPDDRAAVGRAFEQLLARPGATASVQYRYRKKAGGFTWMEAVASNQLDNPEVRGLVTNSRDISTRKQAELALGASEERYAALSAAANEGMFDWDLVSPGGRASDRWLEIHGLPRGATPSLEEWRRMVHPEDLALVDRSVQEHLAGKTPIAECKFRLRDARGTEKWLHSRAIAVRDAAGKPVRAFGAVADITEQKRAEEASREGEQRFRILAEAAFEGIAITEQGVLVDCNEQLAEMLGHGRSELPGRTVAEFIAPGHRDLVAEAQRSGRLSAYEHLMLRADGSEFPVEVRARAARVGGREVRIAAIRDISERKRTEEGLRAANERLQALIHCSPVAIVVVDPEGRVKLWNPASERVFGWREMDVLDRFLPYVPADQRAEHDALRARVLRGEGFVNVEVHRVRKDGSRVDLSVSTVPLRDAQGRIAGILSVNEDITERRRAEEARLELHRQLINAQKMESVGRLAGGVAHDFNNLLSVVLSGAEELRRNLGESSTDDLEVIEDIRSAGARARDLAQQLLAFARRQEIVPIPCDLSALVRGSESLLRRSLREDIELVGKLEPAVWPVRCDPGQLTQALLNLAMNARDAMPNGGRLTIETENAEVDEHLTRLYPWMAPGAYVRLVVRDTGLGMSPEVRTHLFEPFYTTKPVGQGSGLGLASVYGIVKQNRGYILVDSEPGRGTTFHLYFPRVFEPAAAAPSSTGAPRG